MTLYLTKVQKSSAIVMQQARPHFSAFKKLLSYLRGAITKKKREKGARTVVVRIINMLPDKLVMAGIIVLIL